MVIMSLQHNFHFIHNLRKFMEDGSAISYFVDRRKNYEKNKTCSDVNARL
uniref:Uncharacterized protein n=1 Tax=Setaria italica TaxID=4555 RepID=K3ZGJ3_SETIT